MSSFDGLGRRRLGRMALRDVVVVVVVFVSGGMVL
jgi:hypothetical protein